MKQSEHPYLTKRQFMAEKRRQFNELCKAINDIDIRCGCFYLPNGTYERLDKALNEIFAIRNDLRPLWKKA